MVLSILSESAFCGRSGFCNFVVNNISVLLDKVKGGEVN